MALRIGLYCSRPASLGTGFGGPYEQYAKASDQQIEGALEQLQEDLSKAKLGLSVSIVGGAYRLQNDAACGPFVRALLEKNQTMRLSKPALETLAIVAYRQPCLRSEIEEVRGVSVDAVLRKLIDMQLVRVVRRSELPGRPWLFGTTQKFLEHFGINNIEDLPGSQELRRAMTVNEKKKDTAETFPDLDKNVYMPENSCEVTFKVKQNKKGEYKLRYFSEVPIPPKPVQASSQQMVTYSTIEVYAPDPREETVA